MAKENTTQVMPMKELNNLYGDHVEGLNTRVTITINDEAELIGARE